MIIEASKLDAKMQIPTPENIPSIEPIMVSGLIYLLPDLVSDAISITWYYWIRGHHWVFLGNTIAYYLDNIDL